MNNYNDTRSPLCGELFICRIMQINELFSGNDGIISINQKKH